MNKTDLSFDTSNASAAQMVEFYNLHCEKIGANPVNKFASRHVGEVRIAKLLAELNASVGADQVLADEVGNEDPTDAEIEESNRDQNVAPFVVTSPGRRNPGDVFGSAMNAAKIGQLDATLAPEKKIAPIGSDVNYSDDYHCPHCGVHLSNGVGHHNQDVTDVRGKTTHIKHDEYEYECLACGGEFGPPIKSSKKANPTGEVREAMKSSLKLDRTVICVETGEVWKNVFQMWKAHPDWMTSAQVDRLTGRLYAAAKNGEQLICVVGLRSFKLQNVGK